MNYTLSRTSPRPGLQNVFTGKTGIKIWYDPGAFPRSLDRPSGRNCS